MYVHYNCYFIQDLGVFFVKCFIFYSKFQYLRQEQKENIINKKKKNKAIGRNRIKES